LTLGISTYIVAELGIIHQLQPPWSRCLSTPLKRRPSFFEPGWNPNDGVRRKAGLINAEEETMRKFFTAICSNVLALVVSGSAFAGSTSPGPPNSQFVFSMVPAPGIGGTEGCLPNAIGRVTITSLNVVENMHVEAWGLPPNTDFDFFVIQVPIAPFGLSWYMGDLLTDAHGLAVGDFIGRFSIGTFIVAPGVAPAPVVDPPNLHDASSNPTTNPVQTYHLGLWFDSPAAAGKATCADKTTPFNSTHNAGIQVLNTSNFCTNASSVSTCLSGPLLRVNQP
jgi:hypothetical protein